ncbi:MAG: histidine kinase [Chloroflexota bacterium]|nr:histidine kinase [Chloroflexota bacterium]
MSTPAEIAAGFAGELLRLASEARELEMLLESTQTEIARFRSREDQARAKIEDARLNPANYQREEIVRLADDLVTAAGRRLTMEGQLSTLQAKRKLLERVRTLLGRSRDELLAAVDAPPAAASVAFDEKRILQAVVTWQEQERLRIARQVHDGPAQAMANVVLQSEISERLYDIDAQRSRQELAALRRMVNRTLQELRGFIFELRPMVLDDLGLVPTLRRYVQTLVDKHGAKVDFSTTGRDRRLPSDDEVAIFRVIQESLTERIQGASAKALVLSLSWKEGSVEVDLTSDGGEPPAESDQNSGVRRGERLGLLGGEATEGRRPDGTHVLHLRMPIHAAAQMVG